LTLRPRTSVWVGACLGFFLISRAPAIHCPFQLNVDEGQMLAQAMRYGQDLTPWRAVDGETGGPLLSWFLLLGHRLGLPFDFRSEHALAAACLAGILLASFAAARRLVGEEAARISLAGGALWLAFTPDPDFVHYSSELVPVLAIAVALAVWAARPEGESGGAGRLFGVGLLLGIVPWAKLQAVPVALFLGLWVLAATIAASRERRCLLAGCLLAGAVLPSAVFLAWVAQAGAWGQFWHSYILANLARAAGKPWGEQATNAIHLLCFQQGSAWLLDAALVLAGACLWRGRAGWRRVNRGPVLLGAGLLAAALCAILRPAITYSHYEQLCLPALLLLVACGARVLLGDASPAGDPRRRGGWLILAVALIPLPLVYGSRNDGWRILEETWNSERSASFRPQTFVVGAVRHFAPDADSLAVWGWTPYLYVDLGIPPSTRDAGYASMTDGNPSQAYIRAAFLRDLEASPPRVIVDTEDYIAGGVRKTAPASFPAFAAYLRGNYRLVGRGTFTWAPGLTLLVDVYVRGS
jgi:hypothetical protein